MQYTCTCTSKFSEPVFKEMYGAHEENLYFELTVYLSAERVIGAMSSVVSMASSVSLVLVDRRRFIFSTTA